VAGPRPRPVPGDPCEPYWLEEALLWLVFAAWTLWTIRSRMIIDIFLPQASNSLFKLLAFLQKWYPLSRWRERERLYSMLKNLLVAARRLSTQFSRRVALPLKVVSFFYLFRVWAYVCCCPSRLCQFPFVLDLALL
jgi:hypothetical protein